MLLTVDPGDKRLTQDDFIQKYLSIYQIMLNFNAEIHDKYAVTYSHFSNMQNREITRPMGEVQNNQKQKELILKLSESLKEYKKVSK